jgi:eukaryotic-like serine/threonine-protein kinase
MTLTPKEAQALAISLLKEDEEADEVPARLSRLLPEALGKYRAVRLLGVGGMGEVYEAEQETPRRRVALKVIRPELASPEMMRRFDLEARILGRLQHPGIAQIFEAGRASGVAGETPYFAMEYVEGQPLPAFAKEKGLGLRERLELFLKVCAAVEHAHRMGVIHRDLKPGNILVDAAGQPRVLDFGVARTTDADVRATTLQTDMGKLLGTLPYMSPEQASGDPDALDTRSDVYSLGVVLYELLGERPPYEIKRGLIPEAVRIIREIEPAPLSSIDRMFRGDLETIAGKALAKEKERRYQSVGALAADIRRYLANEPIEARPASAMYQVRKFARRNRGVVVAVLLIVGTLAASTLVASWFAVEAWSAGKREARERARAQEQAQLATEQRLDIERLSDESRAVLSFLEDMLASAKSRQGGEDVRMIDVIRKASATPHTGRSPAVRASISHIIGKTLAALGDYEAGEQHLRRSYQDRVEMLGADHPDTAAVLADLASALEAQDERTEAIALAREALRVREAILGPDHFQTISSLISLAEMLRLEGRREESESLLTTALGRAQAVLGNRDRFTMRARLVKVKTDRAKGHLQAARSSIEGLYADAVAELGKSDPDTFDVMRTRVSILEESGLIPEATAAAREMVDSHEMALGSEHPDTMATKEILAAIHLAQREHAAAEAIFRELLPVYRRRFGGEHERTLGVLNGLAIAAGNLGKTDEACELLSQALEAAQRKYGGGLHMNTTIAQFNLARALHSAQRGAEAEPHFAAAIEAAKKLAPGAWVEGVFLAGRGASRTDLGRFDDAYADLTEAIQILEASAGAKHYRTTDAINNMVVLLEKWGRGEEAEAFRAMLSDRQTHPPG